MIKKFSEINEGEIFYDNSPATSEPDDRRFFIKIYAPLYPPVCNAVSLSNGKWALFKDGCNVKSYPPETIFKIKQGSTQGQEIEIPR